MYTGNSGCHSPAAQHESNAEKDAVKRMCKLVIMDNTSSANGTSSKSYLVILQANPAT